MQLKAEQVSVPTEIETKMAKLISELVPSIEMVRMVN